MVEYTLSCILCYQHLHFGTFIGYLVVGLFVGKSLTMSCITIIFSFLCLKRFQGPLGPRLSWFKLFPGPWWEWHFALQLFRWGHVKCHYMRSLHSVECLVTSKISTVLVSNLLLMPLLFYYYKHCIGIAII